MTTASELKAQGDASMEASDFTSALPLYEQALVSDGCDSDLWARLHYNLAVCHYKLGNDEECASAAGTYIMSNHTAAPNAAFHLFFWAMTGQTPPQGMPG